MPAWYGEARTDTGLGGWVDFPIGSSLMMPVWDICSGGWKTPLLTVCKSTGGSNVERRVVVVASLGVFAIGSVQAKMEGRDIPGE